MTTMSSDGTLLMVTAHHVISLLVHQAVNDMVWAVSVMGMACGA